jgi:hypothetical protein
MGAQQKSEALFERAETTRERVRAGATAMQELQGFVLGAEQMSPRPAEIDRAVDDAQRRIELIRRTVGGRGGYLRAAARPSS